MLRRNLLRGPSPELGGAPLTGRILRPPRTLPARRPSPYLDQPGYALVDANLVYRFAGDRFSIGLHGKNLTDKRYITLGYQFLNLNSVTGQPVLNATAPALPP